MDRLAGGIVLEPNSYAGGDRVDLALKLDQLAFEGFEMSRADATVVLEDFTDRALGRGARAVLLSSIGGESE
jgi:hypothetical protein